MMTAAAGLVTGCIGLAPSTPARHPNNSAVIRTGEFGPEEYGITSRDPAHQPAMPDLDHEERLIALASLGRESRFARDERQRGIVIESLPCPLLIITGTNDKQWPRERYTELWLAADHLTADGASHWGLVLNRRVLATVIPAVLQWIERTVSRHKAF
jgi:pimeloyl-ACP methyl ester carboxylesterase